MLCGGFELSNLIRVLLLVDVVGTVRSGWDDVIVVPVYTYDVLLM
jgi:hypothetical protein